MGAKCYHPGKSLIETGYGALTLHTNSSDVPDGVEHYNINVRHYRRAEECTPALYFVEKRDVNYWLKDHKLPLCDDVDPLVEKKADLAAKEQKANELKPVADAAAFAIEQSRGDGADEVSQELRIHWSAGARLSCSAERGRNC